jgi:hypothetical protein
MARAVPIDVASRVRRRQEAVARWAATHRRRAVSFYALLTLVGTWLSVGPPLGLWPIVYWLPGFNFIRVSSRFTILALLGLAVLAGIGFERLTGRLVSRARVVAATLVTLLLVAEFIAIPITVEPAQLAIPEADRWLDRQPTPVVVAEVPVPSPKYIGPYERRQTAFMRHSMAHWHKTVHGYSGIRPPEHEALYASLRHFPDPPSLQRLSDFGVTHLVIHTDWYAPGEWAAVETRLEGLKEWLRLEHVAGDGRVYSLRAPGNAALPILERTGLAP